MNLFDKKVSYLFRDYYKKSEGDIGIEIEVEGENLLTAIPKYWICHKENSLRGESMEYVFSEPYPLAIVRKALEFLDGALKANDSKLKFSNRTSVHVHVNVQDLTMLQAYNFAVLYLIFENILVNYAGPTRVGNLFCLRGVDAEALIKKLIYSVEEKRGFAAFEGDGFRYAALNFCATPKFGSFEFRALRGTMDLDLIELWVNTLYSLREKAKEFENPQSIIMAFSAKGPNNFLTECISEEFIKDQRATYIDDLYEGVRLVQDFAYCTDWIEPKEPVFKEAKDKIKNKFGREEVVHHVHARGIPVDFPPIPGLGVADAVPVADDEEEVEDIEDDMHVDLVDDEPVEAPMGGRKRVAGRDFQWNGQRWVMV